MLTGEREIGNASKREKKEGMLLGERGRGTSVGERGRRYVSRREGKRAC
jgi:hypothetical protein